MVGMCSHINSVILVSVIDASNSNEDSVVREYLSCFVVQLVCCIINKIILFICFI